MVNSSLSHGWPVWRHAPKLPHFYCDGPVAPKETAIAKDIRLPHKNQYRSNSCPPLNPLTSGGLPLPGHIPSNVPGVLCQHDGFNFTMSYPHFGTCCVTCDQRGAPARVGLMRAAAECTTCHHLPRPPCLSILLQKNVHVRKNPSNFPCAMFTGTPKRLATSTHLETHPSVMHMTDSMLAVVEHVQLHAHWLGPFTLVVASFTL